MDVFSRTFLPVAVVWAGGAIPNASRQLPVLHRCVEADDPPLLLTRCTRPEGPARGEYLLLLTWRRLVVTHQTSLLHRVRLHLNTELRHLGHVTWHADDRLPAVELAATAVDGIRERFLIRAAAPGQVWRLDALFERVFRPAVAPPAAVSLAAVPAAPPAAAIPAAVPAAVPPAVAPARVSRPRRRAAAVATR